MRIFQRIHDRLLAQRLVLPEQVREPSGNGAEPTDAELAAVHCPDYLAALSAGTLDAARARRVGFGDLLNSSPLLMRRTRAEAAGTLLCARLALEHGLAVATAGGTHHARGDGGSGFCVINDMAYAACALIASGEVGRVAIVDLDVHQGDGCASILSAGGGGGGGEEEAGAAASAGSGGATAPQQQQQQGQPPGRRREGGGGGGGESDGDSGRPPAWVRARVFTLSVHARNNFPARKVPSSLDVALEDGAGDGEYLAAVASALARVLAWLGAPLPPPLPSSSPALPSSSLGPGALGADGTAAGAAAGAAGAAAAAGAEQAPSAAPAAPARRPCLVLFDAGVDVHAADALGRLSLTDAGLRRRELLVLDTFLAAGVPVAGLVGGGYDDDLDALAERHMHLHRAALRMWEEYGLGRGGGWGKEGRAGAGAASAGGDSGARPAAAAAGL